MGRWTLSGYLQTSLASHLSSRNPANQQKYRSKYWACLSTDLSNGERKATSESRYGVPTHVAQSKYLQFSTCSLKKKRVLEPKSDVQVQPFALSSFSPSSPSMCTYCTNQARQSSMIIKVQSTGTYHHGEHVGDTQSETPPLDCKKSHKSLKRHAPVSLQVTSYNSSTRTRAPQARPLSTNHISDTEPQQ